MSHTKIYRLCLLSVVILTIIGGIFYYVNYVKSETSITEGTLVQREEQMQEPFKGQIQEPLKGQIREAA